MTAEDEPTDKKTNDAAKPNRRRFMQFGLKAGAALTAASALAAYEYRQHLTKQNVGALNVGSTQVSFDTSYSRLERREGVSAPREVTINNDYIEVVTHRSGSFRYDIPANAPRELYIAFGVGPNEKPPEKITLNTDRFDDILISSQCAELPGNKKPPMNPISVAVSTLRNATKSCCNVAVDGYANASHFYPQPIVFENIPQREINAAKALIRFKAIKKLLDEKNGTYDHPPSPSAVDMNYGSYTFRIYTDDSYGVAARSSENGDLFSPDAVYKEMRNTYNGRTVDELKKLLGQQKMPSEQSR